MLVCPVVPPPDAVIAKLCTHLGYRTVADTTGRADLGLYWDPSTWREPPPELAHLAAAIPVINLQCRDFSKKRVDDAHARVFARSLQVDPLAAAGAFVVKSDRNARHDGRIVNQPIEGPVAGFVYQRVVNNEVGDGTVVDLRTPIVGGRIPLVYKLYRPVEQRFSVDDTRAEIIATPEVFSEQETALLVRFAAAMRMDYGELDVLRDRESGWIWVVDANPTPWGPPRTLGESEHRAAVAQLSAAFHSFASELIAAGPAGKPSVA